MDATDQEPHATVDLLLWNARFTLSRAVGLAVFERNAVLLSEQRVEVVELPLDGPPIATLHLTLGVQPIALVDSSRQQGDEAPGRHPEQLSAADLGALFPEIEAL